MSWIAPEMQILYLKAIQPTTWCVFRKGGWRKPNHWIVFIRRLGCFFLTAAPIVKKAPIKTNFMCDFVMQNSVDANWFPPLLQNNDYSSLNTYYSAWLLGFLLLGIE